MKNSKPLTILAVLSIISTIFLIQSCGYDTSMQPQGNYISGYAAFVDTNYVHYGGQYSIALYSSSTSGTPLAVTPISMSGTNPFYYRIQWDGTGACYAAIVWVRNSGSNELPIILGTYGCDTSHTCNSGQSITFPNFSGANYNIICWTDTTQRLN
jgi:hypothetical protein